MEDRNKAGAAAESEPVSRVPLVREEDAPPVIAKVFEEIRASGRKPSNMHRSVANAPEIAASYFHLAWTLRSDDHVSRQLRELAILRTLQLEEGDYEFQAHTRLARACGVAEDQIAALQDWRTSDVYTAEQRAVLNWVESMATTAGPDSACAETMAKFFDPHALVEITLTSAFYMMSARATKALAVKPA